MTQLILPEDGSHWYRPDGTTCHQVEMVTKPGEYRDTTIRDARKLGLLASVSVKLRVLNKPALNAWRENQVLLSAMTLPVEVGESQDEFARRVVRDSRRQGEQAANFGSRIHSFMEWMLSGGQFPQPVLELGDFPIVDALTSWLGKNPIHVYELEHNMADEELWYGGRLDCVGEIPSLGVPKSIIDWKTQEIGSRKGFNIYPENKFQAAAYARLYSKVTGDAPLPTCVIYIARDIPGLVEVKQYDQHEGWTEFLACSILWRSIYWDREDDSAT